MGFLTLDLAGSEAAGSLLSFPPQLSISHSWSFIEWLSCLPLGHLPSSPVKLGGQDGSGGHLHRSLCWPFEVTPQQKHLQAQGFSSETCLSCLFFFLLFHSLFHLPQVCMYLSVSVVILEQEGCFLFILSWSANTNHKGCRGRRREPVTLQALWSRVQSELVVKLTRQRWRTHPRASGGCGLCIYR